MNDYAPKPFVFNQSVFYHFLGSLSAQAHILKSKNQHKQKSSKNNITDNLKTVPPPQ